MDGFILSVQKGIANLVAGTPFPVMKYFLTNIFESISEDQSATEW
jgi:hypothetical protein